MDKFKIFRKKDDGELFVVHTRHLIGIENQPDGDLVVLLTGGHSFVASKEVPNENDESYD